MEKLKEKIRDREDRRPEQVVFRDGSKLTFQQNSELESVELFSSNGKLQLSIRISDQGQEIDILGDKININAARSFSVNSPSIELNASKEIVLRSEGNFKQEVKRDVFSKARIQNIEADLGNVNIKANDDVRLDGERVKLNCD